MADITKRVKTRYELDATKAAAQAKILQRRMAKLGRAANKVTRGISGIGRALLLPAGLGIGAGVGLVKHLVDVGREAEDTKLQITGLLQSVSRSSNLPLEGFEKARETSARLRLEFIRLAKDSPIAARQVSEAFKIGVFPLSRAGISLAAQAEFARSVSIADLQNKVQGTAALDIKQILQGTATDKAITTSLLRPIAKAASKLAKSGELKAAVDLISTAITPDPKLLDAFRKSTSGTIATFSDKLRILKEKAAGPLLEFGVKKLSEWVDWLEKNEDKARDIAKAIGRGIVKAIKAVISVVKFLANNWETVLTIVKTLAVVWIAGKLVSGISSLISLASRLGSTLANVSTSISQAPGTIGATVGRAGALVGGVGLVAAGGQAAAALVNKIAPKTGTGGAAGVSGVVQGFLQAGVIGGALNLVDLVTGGGAPARFSAETGGKAIVSGVAKSFLKAGAAGGQAADLEAAVDPTKAGRRRGGKGRKVKKMIVEKFEVRDRDFARLSSKFVTGVRRESRATRQIAGLGLGAGAVGVGV